MPKKPFENQSPARRTPAQPRALQKIELILEASRRLIDQDGLAHLNTNRIAVLAGVSIGTLYQYFPDKAAIVAELGQREMAKVMQEIVQSLGPAGAEPGPEEQMNKAEQVSKAVRVNNLVRAVMGAFGGRTRVHRELLEAALSQGYPGALDENPKLIAGLLSSRGFAGLDGGQRQLSPAQAFVLTQAFAGVIRAWVRGTGPELQAADVEQSLSLLVSAYLVGCAQAR